MPEGSKRPYTRKQKQDTALAKHGSVAAKKRRAQAKAKPKKRPALKAAKHRVKRAVNKGKKVKY